MDYLDDFLVGPQSDEYEYEWYDIPDPECCLPQFRHRT